MLGSSVRCHPLDNLQSFTGLAALDALLPTESAAGFFDAVSSSLELSAIAAFWIELMIAVVNCLVVNSEIFLLVPSCLLFANFVAFFV